MVTFIHIPRTGGLALTEALRGTGVRADGHRFKLSDPDVDEAITIVRDPVARFISAYDVAAPAGVSIEDLARDPSLIGWWFLDRAVTWLDCEKPLLWVGRTETLAQDVERLRVLIPGIGPLPRYNESRRHSTLSSEGQAAVRDWYADDYALLERFA